MRGHGGILRRLSCRPFFPTTSALRRATQKADIVDAHSASPPSILPVRLPSTWKHASPGGGSSGSSSGRRATPKNTPTPPMIRPADLIPRYVEPTPRFPVSILTRVEESLRERRAECRPFMSPQETRAIQEYACMPDKFRIARSKGKVKGSFKRILQQEMQAQNEVHYRTPQRPHRIESPLLPSDTDVQSGSSSKSWHTLDMSHPAKTATVAPTALDRQQRVAEAVHRNLQQIVGAHFGSHAFLQSIYWTITRVEMSVDLKRAAVYWLPLEQEVPKAEQETFSSTALMHDIEDAFQVTKKDIECSLERAGSRFRWLLSGRMRHLRFSPELVFCYDHPTEQHRHLQQLLDHVQKQEGISLQGKVKLTRRTDER